ncbi:hypothetical protein HDE_14272 [Halotydeus destructor]|nr:hypothetical protein HDE_14272 [Halotydeus destructor]
MKLVMRSTVSQHLKLSLHLWKILCLFGLIYSIVIFSDDYLSRHEVSNSQNPSLLKPGTKFFESLVTYCMNGRKLECFDQLTKLTSDEVLDGTYDLSYAFLDHVIYEKNILTKYEEQSYINKFFKCSMYTFNKNLDPYSGLTFAIKKGITTGQLIVYLTPRASYPRGMQMPFLFVRNFLPGEYDWKFNHILQVKMEAPYPDNCFNYQEKDMEDQDHCLEKCIYEANDKVMPYVFGAIRGENYKFGNMTTLYNEKCFTECSRRNCTEELFFVDNVRVVASNKSTAIRLRTTEKSTVVKYEPHIAFDKYQIYIGGLLSTWFGFYMFNLDREIFRFLRKQGRGRIQWQLRLAAKLLLSLCCFAGCALQIWLSAESYFRYEVQSEAYIGYPISSRLRMPDMSMCFDIMDVLDKTKMAEKSLCSGLNTSTKALTQCQDELIGKEFQEIDDVTFQKHELIQQMYVYLPSGQVIISGGKMSSLNFALGIYFKGRSKCLKIATSEIFGRLEPSYKQMMHLAGRALIFVELRNTTLQDANISMKIYLHSDDTLPFGLTHSALETGMKEYEMVLYAYHAFKLLPSPYSSKCFDYRADKSIKLVSQQDCIEKCMLKHSGSHTCQAVISTSMLERFYLDDHEVSGFVVKNCQRRCFRPDCSAVDYHVASLMRSFLRNGYSFGLSLSPLISELSLTADLKLLEVILYVASVSGLYFSFSLLSAFKLVEQKMETSREKQNGATSCYPSGRVSRCLILVFLGFGFALHTFFTLVMYFERNTITNAAITDAKKVNLPGMTLCFHFGSSLNKTYLSPECLELKHGISCLQELFRYSPYELNMVSKNLSQLIRKLDIRKPDGKSWEAYAGQSLTDLEEDYADITYYLSYKCFTIGLDREYDYKKLEYNTEPLEVVKVSGVSNISILLMLHSIDIQVRQNFFSVMTHLTEGRHRKIAYFPNSRVLLPSPYEPTCTLYDDPIINSQDACIDSCRQSMSRKYFKHSAFNFLRFSDDKYKPAKHIPAANTSQYCKGHCLHPKLVIFSDDYLARNEVSNTEIHRNQRFPSVSFCLRNPSLLKPGTKLFQTIVSSCRKERGVQCINKMTDLTSDEVLNGTYGLSKVFLKQIVYEKKILTKYEERSYISKFFKCSMYTFDKNLDPYSGLTFGIKDDAVNGQLMVYLTSRESYPRGMHMPFMFIQNFLPGHYDWKFNSGKQIKMEAPYPDNCFDYRKEGMDNQDHCLEKCIYEANGKVMPYVFGAISGENYRFGNMTSLYVEKCFRKCSRRSCMDEIFTVDNIWTSLSNLSTAIHLRTTEKALKLTYQPHISFDKYGDLHWKPDKYPGLVSICLTWI